MQKCQNWRWFVSVLSFSNTSTKVSSTLILIFNQSLNNNSRKNIESPSHIETHTALPPKNPSNNSKFGKCSSSGIYHLGGAPGSCSTPRVAKNIPSLSNCSCKLPRLSWQQNRAIEEARIPYNCYRYVVILYDCMIYVDTGIPRVYQIG